MASRKEQKERLRQERLEREQAAASSASRRRTGYAVAGLLAGLGVIAILVLLLAGGEEETGGSNAATNEWPSGTIPGRTENDLDKAAQKAGCVLRDPKSEGEGHTESRVTYKSQPPTSGEHYPTPAHDAATLATPKPYESLVHALEHGRVIFWFKPTAPAATRGALKKLYEEEEPLVVLTPNTRPMPYEVAATAWERLLGCRSYNDRVPDALRAFRDAYRLKGPEYVPQPE